MEQSANVRLDEMRGAHVYDSAGEQIGSVEEIFYDEQTRAPEWIGIGTGFLGTKRVLVPVQGSHVNDDGLVVGYAKDKVKDSPDIDADEITHAQESELFAYYGLSGGGSAQTAQTTGDQSVTRSEEELSVGKKTVDAGSVRLRKWVETEPVALDVELRRETARVVREQLDGQAGDAEGAFQEQEIEVPLHAEQAVVAKDVVAKERVGVETQVETRTQTIEDEVRKERVEVEGDDVER